MRRYRQPGPPPRSVTRRAAAILGWILLGLAVAAAGVGGGVYLWFHESLQAVTAHSKAVKVAERQLHVVLPGQPAVALLLGDNQRMGAEASAGGRSDTILLIRADPATKTISMLSLPRDLRVPVWCPRDAQPLGTTRIDYAFAYCGPAGSLETVQKLTGLRVNYLITVDFHGFKEIVNDLGGVWLDIDRRYYNRNLGTAATDYSNIDLQPGYQLLSGGSALQFVRFRHTDSDFYRQARQQEFLRALKDQLAQHLDPLKLPKIVSAIVHNVEVGACASCLGDSTVLGYALFALTLPHGHLLQNYVAGTSNVVVGGADELQAPAGAVAQAVAAFIHPRIAAAVARRAPRLAAAQEKAPPPSRVTLTVLNGNGVPGAAASADALLDARGYRSLPPPGGAPANAPTMTHATTEIYFNPSRVGSAPAASALADLLAPAAVRPLTQASPGVRALDPGATLLIIVGQSFHETLTTPAARLPAAATVTSSAAVSGDPALTRQLLEPLARRAGFPLELPTMIESSSAPDTLPGDTPARLYTIAPGKKALRLVFRTGGNEFWGVEETDWNNAPILASPSITRTISGRRFKLYYVDAKLHMVVLATSKGSYWVVNTLLDSLSNRTMLAIARGLRPLR